MNTLHFKYAVEVERTGSISQAAENLFMAQPNLSKAIRELEDTLGITIFKRTSKGAVPTDEGREFLKYAKNILCELKRMESIYAAGENAGACKIRLAVPREAYAACAASSFLSIVFKKAGMDFSICECDAMEAIKNVYENNYTLAAISVEERYEKYFLAYLLEKGLSHQLVWEYDVRAVLSAKNPLADKREISIDELYASGIRVCYPAEQVPYIAEPEFVVPEINKGMPGVITVNSRAMAEETLELINNSYMLCAGVPEELLKKHALAEIKLSGDVPKKKDFLIYPAAHVFTDSERLFIDELFRVKNKVAFVGVNAAFTLSR